MHENRMALSGTSFFSLSLRSTEDSILHNSITFRIARASKHPTKEEGNKRQRKTVGEKNRSGVCVCVVSAVLLIPIRFRCVVVVFGVQLSILCLVLLLFFGNDLFLSLSFACYGTTIVQQARWNTFIHPNVQCVSVFYLNASHRS